MVKRQQHSIQRWAKEIGWNNRVKAVCKPCWELKYCPYGPLVEQFPLPDPRDERSCLIFGHHYPVFYAAEPFTETWELRNVSRHIPRPMQFRVLKRDNQICAMCGRPVLDKDIHFDHIIPWSKGGPTEEHNIRLLCDDCNRKRGASFEGEYLVSSFVDHVVDPVGSDFAEMLWLFVTDVHEWRSRNGRLPNGQEVAEIVGVRKKTAFEDRMAEVVADLQSLFAGQPPTELSEKMFRALSERWGFASSSKTHKISTVARKHRIDQSSLVLAEMALVRRLGWPVKDTPSVRAKWARVEAAV
jgi:hypothetical protein